MVLCTLKVASAGKCKSTSSPKKKKEVRIAVMEAINKGTIENKVRSKLNISTANTIPAMGALKIEDIAAAAAAPTNKLRDV